MLLTKFSLNFLKCGGPAASSACLDMPLGRLNHPETKREGVYCTLSSVGCLGHELNVSMSISPVFIIWIIYVYIFCKVYLYLERNLLRLSDVFPSLPIPRNLISTGKICL